MKGPDDTGRNQKDWNGRRHHAHAQSCNDIGGGTGRRLTNNRKDRFIASPGIILGHQANQNTGNQSNNGGIENTHRGVVVTKLRIFPSVEGILEPPFGGQHPSDNKVRCHNHQPGRKKLAHVEGFLRIAPFAGAHKKGAQNRHQNAGTGQDQGKNNTG